MGLFSGIKKLSKKATRGVSNLTKYTQKSVKRVYRGTKNLVTRPVKYVGKKVKHVGNSAVKGVTKLSGNLGKVTGSTVGSIFSGLGGGTVGKWVLIGGAVYLAAHTLPVIIKGLTGDTRG